MLNLVTNPAAAQAKSEQLAARLRASIAGDVRFDALARTLYSTDASIYEIVPLGVVLPKGIEDVVQTLRLCHEESVSIVARGAGTGLTGGAVGSGVQLDFSRHMNRIGRLDTAARTIEVEPGVVLDELNAHLAPHRLHFAPDVATSSRATIGGMIANNSCGARSVRYGRTVDHVQELTVVLPDGTVTTIGASPEQAGARRLRAGLTHIRDAHAAEIARRFPKVMRSNGGYGLDRLGPPGTAADPIKILCGSEGTLAVIVGAKLRLEPVPSATALVVLQYRNLLDALSVVPALLAHRPSAVELIDRLILDAARGNARLACDAAFVSADAEALLVVEFLADGVEEAAAAMAALAADADAVRHAYAVVPLPDTARQNAVWNIRKAGLGLLMSRPGDEQPYSFVEDTAVEPARLRDYIERFEQILAREAVTGGYYAHASVGCLHVKPVLNLKRQADVDRMRRIAEAVCDLAVEFAGAFTAEHGDGIVRSEFLERVYGPTIMQAFREVKRLFDPEGLLNPGKIVDAQSMTAHLRQGATLATTPIKTFYDFSRYGGMAGLAGMCSGVGQCRQRLVGTMCPSYMATGDETHTTRARANALRVALSNRGLLDGLDDPHLHEVMDLCLSCKACKTECPTGVDMARLKAEYLARCNLSRGAPRRARLIASVPRLAATASRFPRLANALAQSRLFRAWAERRYGLDRRVPPPRFARQTFRGWFNRHSRKRPGAAPAGRVVLLADTWTNYFTPQVGIAAVRLLEAAGFKVLCPITACCGRPAISQGLLAEAQQLAAYNVQLLAPLARGGIPILGLEPSCILTLVDDYPALADGSLTRLVAEQAMMLETFLARLLEGAPQALHFADPSRPLLYHGHCHQKALIGTADAMTLLRHAFGSHAREIPSGCCGMAGAFGHEVEHYEVARAVGEQRLFPAVRARGDADVAVSGFSCRCQIAHHADATPRHVAEVLAAALL